MRLKLRVFLLAAVFLFLLSSTAFTCTIFAVGKDAMADGSTVITHNDDSSVADFRLWIIPAMDWPEGSMRDIVLNSHNYIDYGNYPYVDVGSKGVVVGQIPQVPHTYQYFHSRYSFINEMGVAMGETTCGQGNTATELGREIRQVLRTDSWGIIDCWTAQDIALERATTAREAVKIMGDLIEEYGWYGSGECINITDGDEVWVAEFYGNDIWVAVRVPDDMVFVGANTMRIRDVEWDNPDYAMYSPNIISFAVERGWYDPDSGEPFRPADVYAPRTGMNIREWRASNLLAPSQNFEYGQIHYPQFIKPDKKLTVWDIFTFSGDWYEGTEFDLTKGFGAGPFGDPFASYVTGGRMRPIGIPLTCYLQISQIKGWLPPEIKALVWFGYGAVGTAYHTPLWPSMAELPEFYRTGSRYEEFRRDSGWWTATYVQEMSRLRFKDAIVDIRNFRDPKMQIMYDTVPKLQELAAELYEVDKEAAIAILSDYAYNTAVAWQADWLKLGDRLLGHYAADRVNFGGTNYPKEWVDALNSLK
jgi:dipeptidase